MTGQELIDYIENGKLQDRHFFIDVEGYLSPIQEVIKTDRGDIILSQEGRSGSDCFSDENNLERYLSEWFDIISKDKAKQLWDNNDREFFVLARDKSERYADCFENWEEIEESFPDALFGFEK